MSSVRTQRRRRRFLRFALLACLVIALVTPIASSASDQRPGGAPGGAPDHAALGQGGRVGDDEQSHPPAVDVAANPALARARGLVFEGLSPGATGSQCAGGYEELSTGSCTHGPDPAPELIDVTIERPTEELLLDTKAVMDEAGVVSDLIGPSGIACVGSGTDGKRVQAIYAVASDRPNRAGEIVPLVRTWAALADSVFVDSAAKTGGERHIRWVHDATCQLDVATVVVSPGADDTFGAMKSELASLGFNAPDRKYLVWMDANVYCGIANLYVDDSPDATNKNNGGVPTFARVDSGCWGRSDHLSEVHELVHMLGGVQPGSPHSTSYGHCTDEYDALCYDDGGAGGNMTFTCAWAHEWLLDCGDDDYFSTNPASGSYLDAHWNVADSGFLTGPLDGSTTTTSPTTAPSSTTSTTSTPATSTTTTSAPTNSTTTTSTTAVQSSATVTLHGTLNKRWRQRAYALDTGTGIASTIATIDTATGGGNGNSKQRSDAGGDTLTVRVFDPDGTLIATQTGPSGLTLALELDASGVYLWEVSSDSSISFDVTVRYPVP